MSQNRLKNWKQTVLHCRIVRKKRKLFLKKNKKNIRQQTVQRKKKQKQISGKKIDNLYAGVYKNCGNLEFLQTKISELKIQSEQEEQFAKQIKRI